jgi:predicted nucleic acid-binding protein
MNGKDNFLLDTNIVLGFLKGWEPITSFLQKHPQATMAVSQITRMELLGYPSITTEEETALKNFLSLVEILPISDAVSDQAIILRRKTSLKLPDALIAATAICFNLVLMTCDGDLLIPTERLQSINPLQL